MDKNIIKVLNELLKKYKLTEISEKLGYKDTFQIKKLIHGDLLLSPNKLSKLIIIYNINVDFIFTGKGNIFK